jgi:hypothetical protein
MGCSTRIQIFFQSRILDPYSGFRDQKSTGSRVRNTSCSVSDLYPYGRCIRIKESENFKIMAKNVNSTMSFFEELDGSKFRLSGA